MWTDQALLKLSDKSSYCREDLFHILSSEKTDLSDSTFRWTLYNLLQDQKLFKTDYDTYVTVRPKVLPSVNEISRKRSVVTSVSLSAVP